ncbi:hypothetical protein HPB51_021601 [Rhipicephalus microplus]|uniref:Uncharacterized protein n=1 Tax=Rhipicephalus microplus TaxID=6941 RepID=A0A9J6EIF3_RHIMP|nr:hypothetical protein HPB51_021601 [Rhipicephalus microplus]
MLAINTREVNDSRSQQLLCTACMEKRSAAHAVESAAVAGGDGMTSPSTQSWNSGGWSAPQPEVTSARPQSWTGGGGVQPPNPTGVGGGANLHEAAVAPVTSDGTYHPASLYTGAQYVPPQEGQQYASGGAVTEGTEFKLHEKKVFCFCAFPHLQQWQEGMPAEGWQTANNQWQGYDSQVGGTSHAGQYEGSSVGAYSPSDDSLHCLEQHQQQQHQQGQSQQLHEQGLPSTAGDSATADVSSPAHPSNFASDSHDGSQGIVGSLQEKSQQYVESGDEGTISMFFQDGSASVHVMKEEGMAEAEESREGHSTHDMQMAPEHVEKQPASLGTESREQEVAAMGMPEDGATVTTGKHETVLEAVREPCHDESVNQEVPDSVLRPEPQEEIEGVVVFRRQRQDLAHVGVFTITVGLYPPVMEVLRQLRQTAPRQKCCYMLRQMAVFRVYCAMPAPRPTFCDARLHGQWFRNRNRAGKTAKPSLSSATASRVRSVG